MLYVNVSQSVSIRGLGKYTSARSSAGRLAGERGSRSVNIFNLTFDPCKLHLQLVYSSETESDFEYLLVCVPHPPPMASSHTHAHTNTRADSHRFLLGFNPKE